MQAHKVDLHVAARQHHIGGQLAELSDELLGVLDVLVLHAVVEHQHISGLIIALHRDGEVLVAVGDRELTPHDGVRLLGGLQSNCKNLL